MPSTSPSWVTSATSVSTRQLQKKTSRKPLISTENAETSTQFQRHLKFYKSVQIIQIIYDNYFLNTNHTLTLCVLCASVVKKNSCHSCDSCSSFSHIRTRDRLCVLPASALLIACHTLHLKVKEVPQPLHISVPLYRGTPI